MWPVSCAITPASSSGSVGADDQPGVDEQVLAAGHERVQLVVAQDVDVDRFGVEPCRREDRIGDLADRGLDLGVADHRRRRGRQRGQSQQCSHCQALAAVQDPECFAHPRVHSLTTDACTVPSLSCGRHVRDNDNGNAYHERSTAVLAVAAQCHRSIHRDGDDGGRQCPAPRPAPRCCISRSASPAAARRPARSPQPRRRWRAAAAATPRHSACRRCGTGSASTTATTYGVAVDPAHVAMTVGASGAFILAFLAAFEAGDRVIVTEPGYPAYRNILQLAGHRGRGGAHRRSRRASSRRPSCSTGSRARSTA